MRATAGGREFHLTHREFELLRYLAEREPSVVSRSELLREVWGYLDNPTTRSVDQAVVRLRKKYRGRSAPSKVPAHRTPRRLLSDEWAGFDTSVAVVDLIWCIFREVGPMSAMATHQPGECAGGSWTHFSRRRSGWSSPRARP
ncbi:MAG: winged helix-turn-helix domain-containing protein [Vicinamibacterales bacterium]